MSADGAKAERAGGGGGHALGGANVAVEGRGEGGGEWAREVIKKILEKDDGVRCGVDIFLYKKRVPRRTNTH